MINKIQFFIGSFPSLWKHKKTLKTPSRRFIYLKLLKLATFLWYLEGQTGIYFSDNEGMKKYFPQRTLKKCETSC